MLIATGLQLEPQTEQLKYEDFPQAAYTATGKVHLLLYL
jgi:hypothetical protein